MSDLDAVYPGWAVEQQNQAKLPNMCEKCKSISFSLTDDGDRTCQCCKCGNYLWKHPGTPSKPCYCIDCEMKKNGKTIKYV